MTSRRTRRLAPGSPGFVALFAMGALVVLMVAGCATSDPYWSREDRNSAESIAAAEAAARAAGQPAHPAPTDGRYATPATPPPAPTPSESEPLGTEDASGAAPQGSEVPEGITAETLEGPATEPAEAGNRIEQSDLDVEDPQDSSALATPDIAPTGGAEPSPGHYEASLELLQQGRLPEAEEGFRRFLAEDPSSDLADNAQFWLAESALRRSDPAAALAGFRAVVENYPEGNKVPDALLKVGFCLAELGEPESAATVYRELMERFPESAAAETARLRLTTP